MLVIKYHSIEVEGKIFGFFYCVDPDLSRYESEAEAIGCGIKKYLIWRGGYIPITDKKSYNSKKILIGSEPFVRVRERNEKFKKVMKELGYVPAKENDKKFLLKNIPSCFKKRINEFDYDILSSNPKDFYSHVMGVKMK